MATEGRPEANSRISGSGSGTSTSKPKKRKYLPHGKPMKRKGAYPLRPGVEGFFITCDGGRERQAAHEAINLLDNFCEELADGQDSASKCRRLPEKPLNKKIKFEDSDASSSDDDSESNGQDSPDESRDNEKEEHSSKRQRTNVETDTIKCDSGNTSEEKSSEVTRADAEIDTGKCESYQKGEEKSVDELIEDELRELGDRSKRHFVSLDSGCNGVIFIQMHKRTGDPSPSKTVEQLLSLAASTRKPMSRFMLRILPVEVSCYASEEEITKAIKPLVSEYFPSEAPTPIKFAVLYDARANTGVDRMTIINAVAKSVPGPHKVDLNNPDQSIIVQIVKTVCLVGVVRRYKELAKYNLRQLTQL